jgi:polyisoprenoid-binding protein YceI
LRGIFEQIKGAKMRKLICGFLLLATFSTPVQAKDWMVDYPHSKLTFIAEQSGQKFQGGFKKFDAQISFDPTHPDTGKIVVNVNIGTIATGDDERDSYLPQKEWFFQSSFPTAQFIATQFRKLGENTFEADGTLTIKGVSRPLKLPFTLVSEGAQWRAQGHITLMRNDFSIGTGSFANESYVKNAVEVTMDLLAKPSS